MIPDLLSALPRASFRGVSFPWTSREARFAQQNVRHRIQHGQTDVIEPQGPGAPTFSYQLPARKSIRFERDLFDAVLPDLWSAMLDATPGELVDPVWGILVVVPEDFSESMEATVRDGSSVTLNFTSAAPPALAFGADAPTMSALGTQVLAAWPTTPGLPAPPRNPIRELTALVALAQAGMAYALGPLLRIISDLRTLEQALTAATDPNAWAAVQLLRELRLLATRLANRGNAVRPARRVKTGSAASPDALAKRYKTTLEALLRLNPDLATMSRVPAGTTLYV